MSTNAAALIGGGVAVLGIEFGSTRIKASLVAPDGAPLATGSCSWENQLRDGIWTYDMADVWRGIASCYASLVDDVRARHSVELEELAALGVSGMMHGYLALDRHGRLLVPFRTWRNNTNTEACARLSELLDFAVPQRWSIAHLYQAILEDQPHVPHIARLTTLAGYVHLSLTGEHVAGLGEASGMFPIDSETCAWDEERLTKVERLFAPRRLGWALRDLLPGVLPAGHIAGKLTVEGAKRLDSTGRLSPAIPLCPPEGDASTGMVATNSVRPRSGNVSAGTSVFAMVVLERSLSRPHEEIDIVVTPDGSPVAMVHSNNGSSDLDAWIKLFAEVARALGAEHQLEQLYRKLLPLALRADPDAGGLVSINYVSGEHITGFSEGRPLFVRKGDSRFTLSNFMRAMSFAALCSLRTGLNILTGEEGVVVEEIRGHGGFFKEGDVGQRMMAAALGVPVSVAETAAEGGAWGMALLACYLLRENASQSLAAFLDDRIARRFGAALEPDPQDVAGFGEFFTRHQEGLAIERAAVDAL